MASSGTFAADELTRNRATVPVSVDSYTSLTSAVSWGAVFAGATAAAALALIFLILGTGLGLSAASPWRNDGVSATTLGVTGILWITLSQVIATGAGGYLAGRLRARWVGAHSDEVYFRDTAHGFLSWAVASLLSAALLSSVIGSIIGGGVQAGSTAAGGLVGSETVSKAVGAVGGAPSSDYFVDSLFRKENGPVASNGQPNQSTSAAGNANVEVLRIFTNSMRSGALPAEDLKYIGQLVAMRTGLAQADAEKRVTDRHTRLQANLKSLEAEARAAADKARKASAYLAMWFFISLLMGAFAASLAATYGGRHRDL